MANPRPEPKSPPRGKEKSSNGPIHEALESFVFILILVFVFRSYVVQAFVIPTGSMAPTLLGDHLDFVCPQCGYHFTTEAPMGLAAGAAVCPMCHFPISLNRATRLRGGDHIFVEKFLYSVTRPRRWDVVVFKDPQEPGIDFIKRLVGLPEEHLLIIDGNVYVKSDTPGTPGTPGISGGAENTWHIARKTDRLDVQNAVWQPIYYSDYIPLDGGQSVGRLSDHPWSPPWVADDLDDWKIAGTRDYRHERASASSIQFDFDRAADGGEGWYAYNEFSGSARWSEPIEDVRIAASFKPDSPGLEAAISTTTRLDDHDPRAEAITLVGRIDAKGQAHLEAVGNGGAAARTLKEVEVGPFKPGVARPMELWYVDQEASLWVDGRRVLVYPFDLPIETLIKRPPPARYPRIAIRVAGSPVTLHQVNIDRDLYYSSQLDNGMRGEGALVKFDGEQSGKPIHIERGEFYCLGDNSPRSEDSRFWHIGGPTEAPAAVNPWIKARLLAAGHEQVTGVVPESLMMGKAIFVYFPGPYAWHGVGPQVLPDFGDMRVVH